MILRRGWLQSYAQFRELSRPIYVMERRFRRCPPSKQTTYSVRVADVTAVPETTESPLPAEPVAHLRRSELPTSLRPDIKINPNTHNVPSQATPISVPVGHPVMRCHSPAPSPAPFAPRHAENNERRSSKVVSPQATFQAVAGSGVAGHSGSCILSSTMPIEILNVD